MHEPPTRHISPRHFRHLIDTGDLDFIDALALAPEVLQDMEADEAISHKHSVERERMREEFYKKQK